MKPKKKPGRPRINTDQETPMDNYNARLTSKQARKARRIGGGNLSAGLRKLIDDKTIDEPVT